MSERETMPLGYKVEVLPIAAVAVWMGTVMLHRPDPQLKILIGKNNDSSRSTYCQVKQAASLHIAIVEGVNNKKRPLKQGAVFYNEILLLLLD